MKPVEMVKELGFGIKHVRVLEIRLVHNLSERKKPYCSRI
jgi:hypothetical protein